MDDVPTRPTGRRRNYKPDLITVAGSTIASEVVDAIIAHMEAEPFNFTMLATVAERELRRCGGDVTTYYTLADRIVKKFSASGKIARIGQKGRGCTWRWVAEAATKISD